MSINGCEGREGRSNKPRQPVFTWRSRRQMTREMRNTAYLPFPRGYMWFFCLVLCSIQTEYIIVNVKSIYVRVRFDTSGRISNLSSSIMRVSPNVLALRLINVFKMLRLFWEIVVHLTDLHKLFQGLNCDARVTVELHKREVYLRQNFARYFMKTKTYCKH